MDIIKVYWFHNTRNISKEMPIGLILLGKVGRILYNPKSDSLAFIIGFVFFVFIHWETHNYLNEIAQPFKNIHSMGIIFSLLFYDSYVKNMNPMFNYTIIKILPFCFYKKYLLFLLSEYVGIRPILLVTYISFTFFYSSNIVIDIANGLVIFVLYTTLASLITLMQIKFRFGKQTATGYIFNFGYFGIWIISQFFSNSIAYFTTVLLFVIALSILIFKRIYETNSVLHFEG